MTMQAALLLSALLAEIFHSKDIDSDHPIYDKAHKFWAEVESDKFTEPEFIKAGLPIALNAKPARPDQDEFPESEFSFLETIFMR